MIEKMERIFLYGLTKDSKEVIRRLMECGCVQINDPVSMADYEEVKDGVERGSANVYEKEQFLSRVGQCIKALAPYGGKKKLFSQRRDVDFGDLAKGQTMSSAAEICGKVEEIQKKISACKSSISKEEFLQASLEPWKELDLPLEEDGTESSRVLLAILPVDVSREELEKECQAQGIGAYVATVSQDKNQGYLALAVHRSQESQLQELLRQKGGGTAAFQDLSGTAAENISASKARVEEQRKQIEEQEGLLAACAGDLPILQLAYDSAQVAIDCGRAEQNLLQTQQAFALSAWVPQRKKSKVEKALSEFTCFYEFREPAPDEDPPVLLKNNRFVEPFESVTEMYSLPSPHGLDPDPFIAPFYFIFFGMMLSDAGYGLLLVLGGFLGAKYLDLGPTAKKMLRMFGYCGISTIFWGAIYGSWFGDAIPVVASTFFGAVVNIPALIDPLKDPMTVLILSLGLGVIQIFTGMGLKAYLMIKRGHFWDAVFDVGFWYCVLGGLLLLLAGGPLGEVGKWLAIAGAAGLILTQGREKKNPVMKLVSGVMSLYDITSYFSDVLSYSRIMALGLSTGVIGSVVNTMGSLPGKNIIGALLFLAVFVFGHLLNMAINVLGSYVHSSRLQYVEFFGKFYESGGKPFAPLYANTKYVKINQQEEM